MHAREGQRTPFGDEAPLTKTVVSVDIAASALKARAKQRTLVDDMAPL